MHVDWNGADRQQAQEALRKVSQAAADCEKEPPAVLTERRRLKPAKLPNWKGLGKGALDLVRENSILPEVIMLTHWSNLLQATPAPETTLPLARAFASIPENRGDRMWDLVNGKQVCMWAPKDPSALSRCLASFMRRAPEDQRPASLQVLAIFPCEKGTHSVGNIADLWSFPPFLSERWMPIVRGFSFAAFPFEMIASNAVSAPRHEPKGIAIFTLSHVMPRSIPKMISPGAILTVGDYDAFAFDMHADHLPQFLALARTGGLRDACFRHRRRSPISSSFSPRVVIDVIFPRAATTLDQAMLLQSLRRCLPHNDIFYGSHSLMSDSGPMILECNGSGSAHHFWPLCSQMLALDSKRYLVATAASADAWTEVMARSRVAAPSTTAALVNADKRRGNKAAHLSEHIAEIVAKGELGQGDSVALKLLIDHVCTATGAQFTEASNPDAPQPGECYHLASRGPRAPAGVIKVLAKSQEDLRKLYAALHGQAIRVGRGLVGIEVKNDLMLTARGRGNGTRARNKVSAVPRITLDIRRSPAATSEFVSL
ncbi:unnamed protein product, partial [Prorocentrum cordatum]